uniref:ATP-dependent dethiobiotin synthetase BioD n=1 Tax=Candidatus Kentrum sp. MB TaxID=2138164 RepID=A0A451BDJ6_9GAMM|nr:MAG: dethiobiotin synthase [Candidatus Kentron sp. MB]VFK33652.1 MAG: dethiobiotin synthase [Candidatus Kentron sp. MB]VFK76347.1 MAG: dethiobiotin synthase [Candidatus Kentron sp. MB]
MPSNLFITGTDTDVGKTWVSLGVMASLQSAGFSSVGMKPVASGCHSAMGALRSEDAEKLLAQSSISPSYDLVNPFAFEPAIAPHIAATEAGREISFAEIGRCYRTLSGLADCCVVEGVGGWLVPLTPTETLADLVKYLELPVILVVGIRLGCLSHALLSVESLQTRGHELLGWVANHVAPETERVDENVLALKERIDAPLLAEIPWLSKPSVADFADRLTQLPELLR